MKTVSKRHAQHPDNLPNPIARDHLMTASYLDSSGQPREYSYNYYGPPGAPADAHVNAVELTLTNGTHGYTAGTLSLNEVRAHE